MARLSQSLSRSVVTVSHFIWTWYSRDLEPTYGHESSRQTGPRTDDYAKRTTDVRRGHPDTTRYRYPYSIAAPWTHRSGSGEPVLVHIGDDEVLEGVARPFEGARWEL